MESEANKVQRWNDFQEATSDGAWVSHADYAKLERAVEVLAKRITAGKSVDVARNAMDEADNGWLNPVLKKAWTVALDEYDEAIMLAMNNPIAREAIEKARNDATQ